MSRYSENHKYDNIHVGIYFIPEMLPNEIFLPITSVAAEDVLPYYSISNYGRIWHIFEKKFMSTAWDGGGYRMAV